MFKLKGARAVTGMCTVYVPFCREIVIYKLSVAVRLRTLILGAHCPKSGASVFPFSLTLAVRTSRQATLAYLVIPRQAPPFRSRALLWMEVPLPAKGSSGKAQTPAAG